MYLHKSFTVMCSWTYIERADLGLLEQRDSIIDLPPDLSGSRYSSLFRKIISSEIWLNENCNIIRIFWQGQNVMHNVINVRFYVLGNGLEIFQPAQTAQRPKRYSESRLRNSSSSRTRRTTWMRSDRSGKPTPQIFSHISTSRRKQVCLPLSWHTRAPRY